jgi:endonuclease YncB( thermonuclease family)
MRLSIPLAVTLLASPAAAATLSGPATVIDGDTLEIAGERIRLFGIDAPELSQTCDRAGERWACGEASSEELRSMIGGYELSCSGDEIDTYGRLVAVCTIAGIDLNKTMVAQGWATAFKRYSERYVADETRARGSKLGLWASNFVSPEEYRAAMSEPAVTPARVSRPATATQTTSSSCSINGNRSRRGDWIYHLPGMPYYAETRAEEIFCSEADAQAAGYRRSRAG